MRIWGIEPRLVPWEGTINYFKIYLFKICNRDEINNEWFGIIVLFIITYLNGF